MSFFAPRKAGRNRLNRAGYLTASFVSSLDNTASIACAARLSAPANPLSQNFPFGARSSLSALLSCLYLYIFPLESRRVLPPRRIRKFSFSKRPSAHTPPFLAAQSCALIIPQRTPIGSLDNTAARLASPPPQTRSLKTSLSRTLFHSPHSCRIIYLSILKSRSGLRSLHLADRISAIGSVISLYCSRFSSF